MEKTLLDRWTDNLEKLTLYTTMLLGVAMLLVAWAHVFYRYALNNSLTWSEEFLKIVLVWFALLSASIIYKRKGHMGIVIFREKMPMVVQEVLVKIVTFLMFAASAITTAVGFNLLLRVQGQHTPALGIPLALAYAAIPVSFALMAVYGAGQVIQEIFLVKKRKPGEQQNMGSSI